MKKYLVSFLLAFVCACAPKTALVPQEDTGNLEKIWNSMLETASNKEKPYRMQLSLRFGQEGDTRRVTAILWGNGDESMRLDVMAGVGVTIGKVMENGKRFLIYTPREGKAYFQDGAARPLLKIGVPLPFNLSQLGDLLNGNYVDVFGSKYINGSITADGMATYALDGPVAGTLLLNAEGRPESWMQPRGWKMLITYEEPASTLPHSLKLSNPDGKMAILLVKERDNPSQPFTDKQMELLLPANTPLLPLSKYKPSKETTS